ncbi:D-alanine--D-alanine ligase [Aestuariivirga sp.]|uniref:D-alanine--D-alanine ligase n=1 Tax=Aestuariivirga sp. TaxID=2650926 RepID=UPI0035932594
MNTRRIPQDTTVAVLMGGWSAERDVSLASGEACAGALRRAGFNVVPVDVKRDRIVSILQDLKPDVAFNALHGKWGEDGCCAAILETLQIPYTHSGVLASSLAMHKEKSKIIFREAGLPVAESKLVDIETVATQHPMPPPYVVKPVAEGSSVGVHIVLSTSNGPAAMVLEQRAIFGDQAMVERFIPGKELTCAVMGDVALGVIDIVSKSSTWYDYNSKYAPGGSQHILPAEIPKDIYRKCQQYALKAHQALGCRGISRADFRYNDTVKDGELILLEVNTQPGMTGTSLVPELAAHAGHSFEDLVAWMVNDASFDR